MARRVKEFIDIEDHSSLETLIGKLAEVRAALPENSEAELKLRGDDVFGRKLCITYFREQTAEEAECEARYAEAHKEAAARELDRLQQELGMVCYPHGKKNKLRIVA